MPHVERAGDRGRWGVDGVHLVAGLGPVEGVGSLLLPGRVELGLQAVQADLLGDVPDHGPYDVGTPGEGGFGGVRGRVRREGTHGPTSFQIRGLPCDVSSRDGGTARR